MTSLHVAKGARLLVELPGRGREFYVVDECEPTASGVTLAVHPEVTAPVLGIVDLFYDQE